MSGFGLSNQPWFMGTVVKYDTLGELRVYQSQGYDISAWRNLEYLHVRRPDALKIPRYFINYKA